jgi:polyferredoxin
VAHLLSLLPPALLTLSVMVAMTSLTFSLVDIEPFDAWVFRIAGWATITVAVAGLAASLFLPMAYCRFGCPTGTLIGYLRFNSRSDRWGRRDWLALSITIFALGLRVIEIF